MNTRTVMLWVLIASIILTLAFIFSNSLRTPEQSLEQSGAVGSFMATIFPPDTVLGGFIHENIRKIAHFVEYALLGAEAALLISFYLGRRLSVVLAAIPCAAVVALVDETLQYFSDRGPAILDVWIDLGGFATGLSALLGAVLAAQAVIKARKSHSNKTENKDG